jgi:hypothetical protein
MSKRLIQPYEPAERFKLGLRLRHIDQLDPLER